MRAPWALTLLVFAPAFAVAQPAKKKAPQPPPPPSLDELKATWASLSASGTPQQVACLRKFAAVKTADCVRFLAGVREQSAVDLIRQEALRVMGRVGVDPAAELLQRALATSAKDPERSAALMGLSSIRPPVDPKPFLSALSKETPLSLRLQAINALRSYPQPEVAERLLALLGETPPNPSLSRSAERTLQTLIKDPQLNDWLATRALARQAPWRDALPTLLRQAGGCEPTEALKEAIYGHLGAPEPAVRSAAADALGGLLAGKGEFAKESQRRLLKLLDDDDPMVMLSAAVALGDIGPFGESLDALLAFGKSRDAGKRALALTSCRLSRDGRVLALAKKGLKDKAPGVRAAAVAYLEGLGTREAVDHLVAGLKKNKSGRLNAEILQALRALTGANPGDDHKAWSKWWKLAREDHALRPPTEETAEEKAPAEKKAAAKPRPVTGGEEGTKTRGVPTYYGTEVVSRRVTFIVDISGSMSAKVGKEKVQTRLDACKEQLKGVIGALPKKARFNLVWFHTTFTPWQRQLVPAGPKQKAAAAGAVAQLKPTGGTNIYDPLEAALQDPEVDTIYLLSDGAPGSGKFVETQDILREVRKLNATRRVAIHTISIGSTSELMTRLAKQNHGQAIVR